MYTLKIVFLMLALGGLFYTACNNQASIEINSDTIAKKDNTEVDETTGERGIRVGGVMMMPSRDIMENLDASEEFSTLATAIRGAGLEETLKGLGPYTLFAPANAGFSNGEKVDVQKLMHPRNRPKLARLVTLHILPGLLKSTGFRDGQKLETISGEELILLKQDGNWVVNGAPITTTNVICRNGIIHVTDDVIMRKKMR